MSDDGVNVDDEVVVVVVVVVVVEASVLTKLVAVIEEGLT